MTLSFSCLLHLFRVIIQVYVPHVLELIEMSAVNSDLQLGALRLLTNLSVTDQHQHLLKSSIRLLLSLLVVGNEELQVCLFLLGKILLKGNFKQVQLFHREYIKYTVCVSGPDFESPCKSVIQS